MRIRILGAHNTESSSKKLACLLIDDVIAVDSGGLTSSLTFAAQMRLKAILLTHKHYDHIRDIPALAMNAYLREKTLDICTTPEVYEALTTHLLNDEIYPRFFERPAGKPTLRFIPMKPGRSRTIEGYKVRTVPVSHSVPAVGYQFTSPEGKTLFCTGDTGIGVANAWKYVSPDLVILEVTASDRYEQFARNSQHLSPALLKQALVEFKRVKGHFPKVLTVHMNPTEERLIAEQIADIASSLNAVILLATEGMTLRL